MPEKPKILEQKQVARTRIFCVEELSLEFSNGEKRIYERMVPGRFGAVMILPVTEDNQLILVREYSAGTHDYQLGLPKGLMEEGETPFEAANREIKEEIGFGATQFDPLKSVSLAPGYFSHSMNIVLARGLFPQKLPGDEPEPLEVVYWPLHDLENLIGQKDFTEARSIAAIYLLEKFLGKEK